MARLIKVGQYENESEAWAARFIKDNLPSEYLILTNVDVYTESGSRLECDQIIIGVHAVYVVEVKGYIGSIYAGKDVWSFGEYRKPYRSFVKKTRDKALILRQRLKRRLTSHKLHAPWVQHVIFVTGDHGHNVTLTLENPGEPICTPDNIIECLTSPERLTSHHYFGPLTPDQVMLAEREIAAIEELKRIPMQWGIFSNIRPIGMDGPYQVSRATWKVDDFEQEFFLRVLDKAASPDNDTYRAHLNSLIEEASLYRELAGIPGVPYVTPLAEDDERFIFGIAWPAGRALSDPATRASPLEQKLEILRSVATTLENVHKRGMVHSRLDPHWIFVSESGEIQILNFSPAIGDDSPHPAPEKTSGTISPAADVFSLSAIFAPLFGYSIASNYWSSGLPDEIDDWLREWFSSALDEDLSKRPKLNELLRYFNQLEAGASSATHESSESLFERVSGASLHGTYLLEESLGFGPAGEVWLGNHNRGSYPLAIYFPDGYDEEFLRGRFSEIANLQHPMIVRAYDMRKVPGQQNFYMVAEWIEGDRLDELIENDKLPPRDTLISLFRDILVALEFIHNKGTLHRGFSPDAIVISEGRPKIVEFSLLPEGTAAQGLIEYTDPRINDLGWRPESDLYAVSAVFLRLLAGITPRTTTGYCLEKHHIEPHLSKTLGDKLKEGFLEVLSDGFMLANKNYLELFGLQQRSQPLQKLPDVFLRHWGLKLTGHEERIARYLIQEFHGKTKVKARQRQSVASGSLTLIEIRANQSLRNGANAAISVLKKKGVIFNPANSKAIRPAQEFLDSWTEWIKTGAKPHA